MASAGPTQAAKPGAGSIQAAKQGRAISRDARFDKTNGLCIMCLAIPAKVVEIGEDHLATVDILGATREISLDLTPAAEVGCYVLVHAGFAIEIVDEQFAQETIELIREFPELAAEEVNGAHNDAEAATSPQGGMQAALASLANEV